MWISLSDMWIRLLTTVYIKAMWILPCVQYTLNTVVLLYTGCAGPAWSSTAARQYFVTLNDDLTWVRHVTYVTMAFCDVSYKGNVCSWHGGFRLIRTAQCGLWILRLYCMCALWVCSRIRSVHVIIDLKDKTVPKSALLLWDAWNIY
jgi:hypothetical protein